MFMRGETDHRTTLEVHDPRSDDPAGVEFCRLWDTLVDRQEFPNPFLKTWWVSNACLDEPRLLCVFSEGRLVGGAAFEFGWFGPERLGIAKVRIAGAGVLAPDHLDVITETGFEADTVSAVHSWLFRPGNRVVDLDGLAGTGALARVLDPYVIARHRAPYADLSAGMATYMAGRPGQLRSTVKRTARRMDASGITYRRVDHDDIADALDRLNELHDHRWANESGFLSASGRFRSAATAGSAKGEVAIHELLDQDGRSLAIEIDLVSQGRIHFYQAGRLTDREYRGSGTLLRQRIIDQAVETGRTEYDMLRGDDAYKADWATGERTLVRARFTVGAKARLADRLQVPPHQREAAIDRVRSMLSRAPSRSGS